MNILLANLTKMVADSGGMAKVTSNFAKEMKARGHHVALVYSDVQEGEFYYPLCDGVPSYDIRHYNGQAISYPWYLKLKREFYRAFNKQKARTINDDFAEQYLLRNLADVVKREQPDIIVSFQPAATKLLLLDLKVTVPIITMCHGDSEDYFHTYPKEQIPAVEQTTVNQVLLPSFAEAIHKHLPRANTVVIGNAVVQHDTMVDMHVDKDRYTIISVGRLSKNHKRPHLLVEAFAKVADNFPQWNVEFWGAEDGKVYYQQLKAKIRELGLENRILLCGTTQDVRSQLLRADIYAIPSAFEGFSLAMTEAMEAGLPTVGYQSAPSVNELIHHNQNGLLCEDGVDSLSQALATLMADKELRARLGAQARMDMQQYAPDIIWNQWEDLLKQYVHQV